MAAGARKSGRLARFEGVEPEPERVVALPSDHPAVVEGRTLFRSRVAKTEASQRFLVSGHNNAKIGKVVEKGPWAGFPIYTLTLEERATCPRSCAMWSRCYGNAMQWPSRWDHTDPDFLPALAAEVVTVGRQHKGGFVVRLHVLGDFYSVRYVHFWAQLLDLVPSLHVYGYTACTVDDPDPHVRNIARAIQVLTDNLWHRFAVRTSIGNAWKRTNTSYAEVIEAPEDLWERGDVVMCPAQDGGTETCGTCGLCWSPNARDKTIGFLLHGIKRATGPRKVREAPAAQELRNPAGETIPSSQGKAAEPTPASPDSGLGVGSPDLAEWAEAPAIALAAFRKPIEVTESARKLQAVMVRAADANGLVGLSRVELCERAGVSLGSWQNMTEALRQHGCLELVRVGKSTYPSIYRVRGDGPQDVGEPPGATDKGLPRRPREDPELGRAELPRSYRKPERPAAKVADPSLPATAAPAPLPAQRIPVDLDEPDMGPAGPENSLTALRPDQCRWIVNDFPEGQGHLARFCPGSKTPGSSYCAEHGA